MPFVLQEAIAKAKAKKEQAESGNSTSESNTTEKEPVEQTKEETEEPESSSETKKNEKFGVQTEKGKVIKVYRNGDKHHEGDRFVVHQRKYKTLDQLHADITTKVGIVTGPVRKLVYLKKDGTFKTINSFDDIKDKSRVLACGPGAPKVDMGKKFFAFFSNFI